MTSSALLGAGRRAEALKREQRPRRHVVVDEFVARAATGGSSDGKLAVGRGTS
jgi:hypothetical protein